MRRFAREGPYLLGISAVSETTGECWARTGWRREWTGIERSPRFQAANLLRERICLMVLSLIDADGNAGNGDTAFSFIGTADNPFTAAGQVSWLIGGADTSKQLNTDGDAEADGVIRVLGAQAVDASWFVL